MNETTENPRAVVGGNKPPLRETLHDTTAALRGEIGDLLVSAAAVPSIIASDDEESRAAVIGYETTKKAKAVDALRKTEKEPFLESGKTVDAFFNPLIESLETATARIAASVSDWKKRKAKAEQDRQAAIAAASRAEADRLARIETERRAAEDRGVESTPGVTATGAGDELVRRGLERRAADADAAAADVVPDTVRDAATGVRSSGRKTYSYRITDYRKIPLGTIRPYLAQAAIDKAVAAFVRNGGLSLAGVEIFEDTKVSFRR